MRTNDSSLFSGEKSRGLEWKEDVDSQQHDSEDEDSEMNGRRLIVLGLPANSEMCCQRERPKTWWRSEKERG
ncbi:hypothetical protein L195_g024881 [Trifolium pratense]|uniref:Uncharacterized protein n=2 Tax=Trifolium pratense TaxID=57577 RepID=A0ACB0LEM7_TRIPR|nr:hypothetical protein L195_g024881 [Trifolium pratense]CAJ2666569.1 unnamed protein product [Trifolium pratense]